MTYSNVGEVGHPTLKSERSPILRPRLSQHRTRGSLTSPPTALAAASQVSALFVPVLAALRTKVRRGYSKSNRSSKSCATASALKASLTRCAATLPGIPVAIHLRA